MTILSDLEDLEVQLKALPRLGHRALAARNGAMFLVDLIIVGAVKRSLSLGHGLVAMVRTKNMTCARAIVRMQIDTVSRLLAYTYVNDPEEMASKVIGGAALNKFKSREGQLLRDAYLIDRMTDSHPWVREVYNRTSGEIHFSEKQLFASVQSTDDATRTMTMVISPFDEKYPEWSWSEVVTCFHKLNEILTEILEGYVIHKNG
jgi:hypothetical protein